MTLFSSLFSNWPDFEKLFILDLFKLFFFFICCCCLFACLFVCLFVCLFCFVLLCYVMLCYVMFVCFVLFCYVMLCLFVCFNTKDINIMYIYIYIYIYLFIYYNNIKIIYSCFRFVKSNISRGNSVKSVLCKFLYKYNA